MQMAHELPVSLFGWELHSLGRYTSYNENILSDCLFESNELFFHLSKPFINWNINRNINNRSLGRLLIRDQNREIKFPNKD